MKIPPLPSPAFFIGGECEHSGLPLVAVAAPQSVVVTRIKPDDDDRCVTCKRSLWAVLEDEIMAPMYVGHAGGPRLGTGRIEEVCVCRLEFPDEELLEAMREGEVSHG